MMRILISLTIAIFFSSCSFQKDSKVKESQVRLLKWSAGDCDNTYDPYRLQNRMTSRETKNGITHIAE